MSLFRHLWLPWVTHGPKLVSGAGDPCGMNDLAARFAALWLAGLGERAVRMVCDARLVAVAQAHADYLTGRSGVELQASMHVGRGGSTPNQRVRTGGYKLPEWHGEDNTCESCVRSSFNPLRALEILLASSHHRPHLMGEGFWAASVVYGIGQVGADWVILIAPPE